MCPQFISPIIPYLLNSLIIRFMRFPLCFVPHFPCVCVPLSCFHFCLHVTCSSLCFTPRSPCLSCVFMYVCHSPFCPMPLELCQCFPLLAPSSVFPVNSVLMWFLPPSHVSCYMLNLCLSVSCFVSAVSCVQCV